MKVYVVMSSNEGMPAAVFKTKAAAHKYLRGQGLHPIGDGCWGTSSQDVLEAMDSRVIEYGVRA